MTMENPPLLFKQLIKERAFRSIFDDYKIDHEGIDQKGRIGSNQYFFERVKIGTLSFRNLLLHSSVLQKKGDITYESDISNLFEDSNKFLLNETYKESNCQLDNNSYSKSYCYILNTQLISVNLKKAKSPDLTTIMISFFDINIDSEIINNHQIIGSLVLDNPDDSGFSNMIVEKFTPEESKKHFKNHNFDLAKKISEIYQHKYAHLNESNHSEFYNEKDENSTVYYSNELYEEFLSQGLVYGQNKIRIRFNGIRCSENDIIIKEILELETFGET